MTTYALNLTDAHLAMVESCLYFLFAFPDLYKNFKIPTEDQAMLG
jgi:hypothetical protein